MKTLEETSRSIAELPPELKQEVDDFVDFLNERRTRKAGRRMRQQWAGALKEYRDQYTSLELQKKALEWGWDPRCPDRDCRVQS
jgi:hypothetical protein